MPITNSKILPTFIETDDVTKVAYSKGQYIITYDGDMYYDRVDPINQSNTELQRIKINSKVSKAILYTDTDNLEDDTILRNYTENAIEKDIVIIKRYIASEIENSEEVDKYNYLPYIYINGSWVKLIESLDIKNIYFTEDIESSTDIKGINKNNGKLSLTGKSLDYFIKHYLNNEPDPIFVEPILNCGFYEYVDPNATTLVSTSNLLNKVMIPYDVSTKIEARGNHEYPPYVKDNEMHIDTSNLDQTYMCFINNRFYASSQTIFDKFNFSISFKPVTNITDTMESTIYLKYKYTVDKTFLNSLKQKYSNTSDYPWLENGGEYTYSIPFCRYIEGLYYGATNNDIASINGIDKDYIKTNLKSTNDSFNDKTIEMTIPKGTKHIIFAKLEPNAVNKKYNIKIFNKTCACDMTDSFVTNECVFSTLENVDIIYKIYCYTPAEPYSNDAELSITLSIHDTTI